MLKLAVIVSLILLKSTLALSQCEEQGITFLDNVAEVDPDLAADLKDLYTSVFKYCFEKEKMNENLAECQKKTNAQKRAKQIVLEYSTAVLKIYKNALVEKKLDSKAAYSLDSIAKAGYPEVYPIFKTYLEKRRGRVLRGRDK